MSDLSSQMDNLATAMIVEGEPAAGLIQSTMRKAATETRKLEADNAKLREKLALVPLKNRELAGLIEDEIRLRADNARLSEALEKYGRHEYGCTAIGAYRAPGTSCDCGLTAALKRAENA